MIRDNVKKKQDTQDLGGRKLGREALKRILHQNYNIILSCFKGCYENPLSITCLKNGPLKMSDILIHIHNCCEGDKPLCNTAGLLS